MFPARRTTPQGSIPMQPSRVNLNVVFTCAMAARVALWGKGTGGGENPRLFKDRPADGNAAACAAPLYVSAFAIAWATAATRFYVSQPAAAWSCALCNMSPGSVFQTAFALWGKGTGGGPPQSLHQAYPKKSTSALDGGSSPNPHGLGS